MKHTRNRRAFAPRPFPISLTSLRREVANRQIQQRTLSPRQKKRTPFRFRGFRKRRENCISARSFFLSKTDPLHWAPFWFFWLYYALCQSSSILADGRFVIHSQRQPIPVPTLPPAATKTALSVPWYAVVNAGCFHPLCPITAYFPRAISSFGAGIQLSASIRHIERAAPANNRPYRVCCSTAMLPFMIQAAIQAARITKNRSRGITSLPVLGAAAAQDEARGREAYFNGRNAPDESIGSSAANGHFIGPAALSVPLSLFTVHPFPWLPVSGSSPCPWRSSPVSSLPSAHDAPGENPPRSAP